MERLCNLRFVDFKEQITKKTLVKCDENILIFGFTEYPHFKMDHSKIFAWAVKQ